MRWQRGTVMTPRSIAPTVARPALRRAGTRPSVAWEPVRLLASLVSLCLLSLLTAAPATAQPNFGDHGQDNSIGTLHGTRSEIKTPSSEVNWGGTTAELFLARVDGETLSSGFLVQAGYGETSPSSPGFDMCGNRSTFHRFNEYSLNGVDYTCNWFSAEPTGTNDVYAVKRIADVPKVCAPDCWEFAIAGSAVDDEGLGHDAVGISYAGEEFNNCTGCGLATAKNAPALYGASGTTNWQWTNQIGGASWTTIQPGCQCGTNTDGNWSRGELPTPFTISHS